MPRAAAVPSHPVLFSFHSNPEKSLNFNSPFIALEMIYGDIYDRPFSLSSLCRASWPESDHHQRNHYSALLLPRLLVNK